MDANAKSKIAIVLGIVILAADLLWLYSSASPFGGIVNRNPAYYNYTGNASTTPPGFSSSAAAFRGGRAYGHLDIIFGLVILAADVIWMYLEFSNARPSPKKTVNSK